MGAISIGLPSRPIRVTRPAKAIAPADQRIICSAGMKIGFAQINPTVGDLRGNGDKILQAYERLDAAGADLVLMPELAIPGYPPQDLLFKSRFVPENIEMVQWLHEKVG